MLTTLMLPLSSSNSCVICNLPCFKCKCNDSVCGECFKKVTIGNNSTTCSQCSLDFHIGCTDKIIDSNSSTSNWLCRTCFTKICLDELPFSDRFIDLKCQLGRGLKIAHINIQSLRFKTDYLHIFIHSNNTDVLCITESWLTHDIDDNEIKIEGYNLYRKDRDNGMEHGGIVIYIKEGIDYNVDVNIDIDNDIEAIFTEINLPCTKPIILGTVYRQPDSNAEHLSKLDQLLQSVTANYNEIIVVGDFNLDLYKPNYSKKVNNLAKNSHFTQLINEPTRITQETSTILDLAFVSHPEMITTHGVHHLGLSDHSLIYVVRKCKKVQNAS